VYPWEKVSEIQSIKEFMSKYMYTSNFSNFVLECTLIPS